MESLQLGFYTWAAVRARRIPGGVRLAPLLGGNRARVVGVGFARARPLATEFTRVVSVDHHGVVASRYWALWWRQKREVSVVDENLSF